MQYIHACSNTELFFITALTGARIYYNKVVSLLVTRFTTLMTLTCMTTLIHMHFFNTCMIIATQL